MTTPQEELIKGAECLRPLLEAKGFQFALGEVGTGSGGAFAEGTFTRGDRSLAFSVRSGLGVVEYRIGHSCINHDEYLRYSGAWGKHQYPNFGGTVQESFAALRQDLADHFQAFLSESNTEFLRVMQARDTDPNRFKGFAGLGAKR